MYGLKQAGFQWHVRLPYDLETEGFIPFLSTQFVYKKRSRTTFSMIIVYVDNVLITADTEEEIDNLVEILCRYYTVRDLGHVS